MRNRPVYSRCDSVFPPSACALPLFRWWLCVRVLVLVLREPLALFVRLLPTRTFQALGMRSRALGLELCVIVVVIFGGYLAFFR